MSSVIVIDGLNVCEENCNGLLKNLYKKRDLISEAISDIEARGGNSEEATKAYHNTCSTITNLCIWRSNHHCLIEGDEGYREH